MNLKLMAVAMLVVCSAMAMPTNNELEEANKEVRSSLKTQIAAWQNGGLSDGDLAMLMLMHAGKFKDEARHYACLQAAFAAAVRAGDAALAANAIEKIAADTKDFGKAEERRLITKAFEKVDAEKLKDFPRALEVERTNIARATPVSDVTVSTIAKMKMIWVPSMALKPPATLVDAVAFLNKAGKEHDPWKEGIKIVLKMAEGESVPVIPRIRTKNISVYHAVELITRISGYDFEVKDDSVVIFKKGGAAKK